MYVDLVVAATRDGNVAGSIGEFQANRSADGERAIKAASDGRARGAARAGERCERQCKRCRKLLTHRSSPTANRIRRIATSAMEALGFSPANRALPAQIKIRRASRLCSSNAVRSSLFPARKGLVKGTLPISFEIE